MPDKKQNPGFDEEPLAKLLEAAFVLQEHKAAQQNAAPDSAVPPKPPAPGSQPATRRAPESEPAPVQVPVASAFDGLPEPAAIPVTPSAAPTPAAPPDYSAILAEIGGIQEQIRSQHLDLDRAATLVTAGIVNLARAGGAALCLIEGLNVRYRSVHGRMTLPAGTELAIEKALCSASLRAGQVIRCSNLNAEFLLDVDECRRRGILAILAVPIYHQGAIAGGLEVYYATVQNFSDQDVHGCQLMAGLITDVLSRKDEVPPKKLPASERAAMLEVLEQLKPSLTALVEAPVAHQARAAGSGAASAANEATCRKCGHALMAAEQFCGKCGTPRTGSYEPPTIRVHAESVAPVESATPSASPVNGNFQHELPPVDPFGPEKPLADSIEQEMPELFGDPMLRLGTMPPPPNFEKQLEQERGPSANSTPEEDDAKTALPAEPTVAKVGEPACDELAPVTALAKASPTPNWSSAASARQFLEELAGANRSGAFAQFWRNRRGDVYLAVAVVLVIGVVLWGVWSNHSVGAQANPPASATAAHKSDPATDLSLWDRVLIHMGLADTPPAPEYKGNPDTQVWVDLHTALYYCPGADLYGKTPKGRFTTQHEAQLDQFEPALRKACE